MAGRMACTCVCWARSRSEREPRSPQCCSLPAQTSSRVEMGWRRAALARWLRCTGLLIVMSTHGVYTHEGSMRAGRLLRTHLSHRCLLAYAGGTAQLPSAVQVHPPLLCGGARGRRSLLTSDGDDGDKLRWIHPELPAPLLIPRDVTGNRLEARRSEALRKQRGGIKKRAPQPQQAVPNQPLKTPPSMPSEAAAYTAACAGAAPPAVARVRVRVGVRHACTCSRTRVRVGLGSDAHAHAQ